MVLLTAMRKNTTSKPTRRQLLRNAALALAARPAAIEAQPADPSALTLWFRQPAKVWTEALPVGNGNLGAMVFGGIEHERIQLNEHSLWSGHPVLEDSADAREAIAQMRKLLLEGKYAAANKIGAAWRPPAAGPRGTRPSYQTLGDLLLDFSHTSPAEGYRRQLDLDTAIARAEYRIGDVRYTREVFVSHPDQAVVVRIAADKPGGVSFTARLQRQADAQAERVAPNQILLHGQA